MDASQLQNFYPFLMMALILVVFYFILIRPQKKKEKALKDNNWFWTSGTSSGLQCMERDRSDRHYDNRKCTVDVDR